MTISGVVTDSSGAPVMGANVSVTGTGLNATTGEAGEFQILGAAPGTLEVKARRLGFVPATAEIRIAHGQPVDRLRLMMAELPRTLRPVVVQSDRVQYTGRLAGYYQRMQRRSAGHFIARDEIDKKSYRSVSHLLRRIPGINAVALKSGGGAVRMRSRTCRPIVFLDGVPMPAAEVDLDAFPTSTLHGIEVYMGANGIPSDFVLGEASGGCGTVLLWSRGRDTDPPSRRRAQGTDLEKLIEAMKVYPADQVEKQAQLAGGEALEVTYPPELFAAGIGGQVLVEFVVDASGGIEHETFSIVSSSHPLLSAAVSRALERVTYTPAMKGGSPVRQAVQQPFSFVPGPRKAAQGGK